jgi:hypothetical protein
MITETEGTIVQLVLILLDASEFATIIAERRLSQYHAHLKSLFPDMLFCYLIQDIKKYTQTKNPLLNAETIQKGMNFLQFGKKLQCVC